MAAAAIALGLAWGCGGDTTRDSVSRGGDTGGTGGQVSTPVGGGGSAPVGGTGGVAGSGGAAGETPLPDLCQMTVPRPPGCPCPVQDGCDGLCLAEASELPCEVATAGICTNPPHGGCVCSIDEYGPALLCIEREVCPEARPTSGEACALLAMPCDYDEAAHERCWCMNRFGTAAWECMAEEVACPYHQPTPDAACEGDLSCLFVTVSSRAYRCDCVESRWGCEAIEG